MKSVTCDKCNGFGFVPIQKGIYECDKCNGTGKLEIKESRLPHLEPCKFCGNDGSHWGLIYDWGGCVESKSYYIRCSKCGAMLTACAPYSYREKMDVADMWNSKPGAKYE